MARITLPENIVIEWSAWSPRRPWQLREQGGDLLRKPDCRGNLYPIAFATSDEAIAWLAKRGYNITPDLSSAA